MEDIIVGIGDAAGNRKPDFLEVSWSQTRSQINNENIKYITSDTENRKAGEGVECFVVEWQKLKGRSLTENVTSELRPVGGEEGGPLESTGRAV